MEIRQTSSNFPTIAKQQSLTRTERQPAIKSEIHQNSNLESEVSDQDLAGLIQGANQFFNITRTHIQFHLHESLNQHYVEIRNSETNEVIKEVPSKKFLDMVAKLQQLAGLIVDEKI